MPRGTFVNVPYGLRIAALFAKTALLLPSHRKRSPATNAKRCVDVLAIGEDNLHSQGRDSVAALFAGNGVVPRD